MQSMPPVIDIPATAAVISVKSIIKADSKLHARVSIFKGRLEMLAADARVDLTDLTNWLGRKKAHQCYVCATDRPRHMIANAEPPPRGDGEPPPKRKLLPAPPATALGRGQRRKIKINKL